MPSPQNLFRCLLALLAFLSSALVTAAQNFNLDTQRVAITSIDSAWRFHPGDDPSWAQPAFDDLAWKIIKPADDWISQGYSEQNHLAWFRFQLDVPSTQNSLLVLIPAIPRSYQLFANGRLIGQTGDLPPHSPRAVTAAPRVFTIPLSPAARARHIVIALRVWQDPTLIGISGNSLDGPGLAGAADAILRQFSLLKAQSLVSAGSTYIAQSVVMVVAAAALLLFALTREGYYLWFALSLLSTCFDENVRVAAQHYAWNPLAEIALYILLDALNNAFYALFLAGLLDLRAKRVLLLSVALNLAAESGPIMVIFFKAPLLWGDLIYAVFETLVQVYFGYLLVRGWRAGQIYARLFFIPFLVSTIFPVLGNAGHSLVDFNVPHASAFFIKDIELVRYPFTFTLGDAADLLSVAGFLACLVYRFAQTSRERQRLATALQAAHEIQQRLVPASIPSLHGLTTEVVYLAAEEVGGDFCQILPRTDGSVLVAIGDVSGKGLQAAMMGTFAVGALRSMADEDIGPADILQRLNQVLLRAEHSGFVTCLCLQLHPEAGEAGEVVVANAGHLAPYMNGRELPVDPGLPLGIIGAAEYSESRISLPGEARLTLLSDGVVEARSSSGELFGFERTLSLSRQTASHIAEEAHRYGQEDDITVITLDWHAPAHILTPA